jgi:hypothetical protein
MAAAGCAALLAAAVAVRRRASVFAGEDPPDREFAPERMEDNATGEGMPERGG